MVDVANDVKCINCGHLASGHNDTVDGENTGACAMKNCDCTQMSIAEELSAIAVHHTGTSDDSWDGPANEANLPSGNSGDGDRLQQAYAWRDPDGDPDVKASYKFIHHFVSDNGTVGKASTTACSTGVGVLNGGRGGANIPAKDHDGVYSHLVNHLKDAGVEDNELPEKKFRVRTLQADGASGASASSGDIESIAANLQGAITAAQQAVQAVTDAPDWLQQAGALLDAAATTVGHVTSNDDPDGRYAEATDAALDAAISVVADQTADNADQQAAQDAINACDDASDQLLAALGLDDPDEGGSADFVLHRVRTLASTAPSGAADAAVQVDELLDQAFRLVSGVDLGSIPPEAQQFIALLSAAAGLSGPSAGAQGADGYDLPTGDAGDPTTPVQLAEAVDAAIVAARNVVDAADASTWPDVVQQAVALVRQADDASGNVLTALGAPDPDVEEGTEPAVTADGADGTTDEVTPPTHQSVGQPGAGQPVPFSIPVLLLEGVDTGDGRFIDPGSVEPCETPATLMAMTENSEFGHEGAYVVGHIDTFERYDASALIDPKTQEPYGPGTYAWRGSGQFSTVEDAEMVVTLIEDGSLRGISADLRDVVSELEILSDDGTAAPIDGSDVDEDVFWDAMTSGKIREKFVAARLAGATICPVPAFEGAYIVIGSDDNVVQTPVAAAGHPRDTISIHDHYGVRRCARCEEGLVAAAAPMEPPLEWFEDPSLSAPTPLTITEDGRVFGHVALWGTCHTGYSGRCVTPPRSHSGYSFYRQGSVRTREGDLVAVGKITMATGHAPLEADPNAVLAHYDNTGTAVADVASGEDRHGIWIAGSLRPDVSELQIRQLRASALSGDWRMLGRGLELLAVLAVNVPGFPITRARVASGATVALVAAGGRAVISYAQHALNDLLDWRRRVEPELLENRAERLRRRVHHA